MAAACLAATSAALAQPLSFGSLHDPTEATAEHLQQAPRYALMGGPSYLGVHWRVVGGGEFEDALGPIAVSLEGHLRASPRGVFSRDVDELYDVLRLIRYVRHDPTPATPVYARLGPIRRLTLDSGLLVRDFATVAAWHDRTVGFEAAVAAQGFEAGFFTGDLLPDNLIGGFVAARPMPMLGVRGWDGARVSIQAVHDLGLEGEVATTAVAAEAKADLFTWGVLQGGVVASHARYVNYGHGTLAAIQGAADLFDLGFLHLRLGLTSSTEQFIPGHFGPFYSVHRPGARIVSSDAYFRDPTTDEVVGTTLAEAAGGTAVFFEIHGIVYHTVEVMQYLRRDFGGDTGAYGLRLAFFPERGRNIRFLFDLQRQGLSGFRALFADLVDEATLTFRIDYAVTDLLHVFVRSRYGYTEVLPLPDGTARYLVERRFEPMFGIVLRR